VSSPLSAADDYPIHQTAEVIRHPAISDRNFYDRYYFMLHDSKGELMVVMGMGQYPNLSVQDAFVLVRQGTMHRIVRASRTLANDRMDTSVGPFKIEILEGLKRIRYTLEPNEHGVSFDLTWTGAIEPVLEHRHYIRQMERVLFDTQRFAQTGFWEGHLIVDGERTEITGPQWRGARDRSWGVRLSSSVLTFPYAPGGPITITATPLIESHIAIGTGYSPEPDWKHGMYQGELAVQGIALDTERDAAQFYGIVDAAARFETNTGDVGYGLHEYMFLGPFPKYNLTGILDGAPDN